MCNCQGRSNQSGQSGNGRYKLKVIDFLSGHRDSITSSTASAIESESSSSPQGFPSLSPSQRTSISEICALMELILVSPATNTVSERSASVRKRVKTYMYLRSRMSQIRVNNLLVLHAHKDRTVALCQYCYIHV